jgi:hypothetical protein
MNTWTLRSRRIDSIIDSGSVPDATSRSWMCTTGHVNQEERNDRDAVRPAAITTPSSPNVGAPSPSSCAPPARTVVDEVTTGSSSIALARTAPAMPRVIFVARLASPYRSGDAGRASKLSCDSPRRCIPDVLNRLTHVHLTLSRTLPSSPGSSSVVAAIRRRCAQTTRSMPGGPRSPSMPLTLGFQVYLVRCHNTIGRNHLEGSGLPSRRSRVGPGERGPPRGRIS